MYFLITFFQKKKKFTERLVVSQLLLCIKNVWVHFNILVLVSQKNIKYCCAMRQKAKVSTLHTDRLSNELFAPKQQYPVFPLSYQSSVLFVNTKH